MGEPKTMATSYEVELQRGNNTRVEKTSRAEKVWKEKVYWQTDGRNESVDVTYKTYNGQSRWTPPRSRRNQDETEHAKQNNKKSSLGLCVPKLIVFYVHFHK